MICKPCSNLISSQNIRFGYLLESPLGDSNKYPKRMFLEVFDKIFVHKH